MTACLRRQAYEHERSWGKLGDRAIIHMLYLYVPGRRQQSAGSKIGVSKGLGLHRI